MLPAHLKNLAGVGREINVSVRGVPTANSVIDALEDGYPMLRGTIRDSLTQRRRPFVRFFIDEEDRSHDDPNDPLPAGVVEGLIPFIVVGAMAGG